MPKKVFEPIIPLYNRFYEFPSLRYLKQVCTNKAGSINQQLKPALEMETLKPAYTVVF